MKVLATLVVLLSFQVSRPAAPQLQLPQPSVAPAHPHGQWYLAENGHAVFCYGPVQVIKDPLSGMQRVATFCKGEKAVVLLRD